MKVRESLKHFSGSEIWDIILDYIDCNPKILSSTRTITYNMIISPMRDELKGSRNITKERFIQVYNSCNKNHLTAQINGSFFVGLLLTTNIIVENDIQLLYADINFDGSYEITVRTDKNCCLKVDHQGIVLQFIYSSLPDLTNGNSIIKYDTYGRIIGTKRRFISYNDSGKIVSIGKIQFSYYQSGRLKSIGEFSFPTLPIKAHVEFSI